MWIGFKGNKLDLLRVWVCSSLMLGGEGEFLALFDSHQNCHVAGKYDFYYVNEIVIYFGVYFGSFLLLVGTSQFGWFVVCILTPQTL